MLPLSNEIQGPGEATRTRKCHAVELVRWMGRPSNCQSRLQPCLLCQCCCKAILGSGKERLHRVGGMTVALAKQNLSRGLMLRLEQDGYPDWSNGVPPLGLDPCPELVVCWVVLGRRVRMGRGGGRENWEVDWTVPAEGRRRWLLQVGDSGAASKPCLPTITTSLASEEMLGMLSRTSLSNRTAMALRNSRRSWVDVVVLAGGHHSVFSHSRQNIHRHPSMNRDEPLEERDR